MSKCVRDSGDHRWGFAPYLENLMCSTARRDLPQILEDDYAEGGREGMLEPLFKAGTWVMRISSGKLMDRK